MKKMMTNIKTLAALLIASATFAACSSDDNEIQNAQPANPTEPQTYTMTIQATKATGGATTRGLYYGTDGALNVNWFEGEEVEVTQESKAAPINPTSIGTLKAKASSNGTTTLTGELTGLEEGKVLRFWLHNKVFNYENQTGVLLKSQGENSIEEKYDFAMMNNTVEDYTVSGSTVSVATPLVFESMQAIVKFTLKDESGNAINAQSLKIECSNYLFEQMDFLNPTTNTHSTKKLTITPTTATDVIYAAISQSYTYAYDYTLTATTDDGKEYTYTKSGVTFTAGKYYEVNVKMTRIIDLSKLTADYTANNGDVLTGTLNGEYKIAVADGASVTLKDITISGNTEQGEYNVGWPGINCLGDATLTLEGTNSVAGYHIHYPGIFCAKKLTIRGDGTLTAQGQIDAAGIGSSHGGGQNFPPNAFSKCGDILIEGGIINATGGYYAPGIGAGEDGECGNITISGGTVTATGGTLSAGIGTGSPGKCGNITIESTVTSVKATEGGKGDYYDLSEEDVQSIGKGLNGQCGTVTIGGVEGAISTSPYTYQPSH